MEKSKGRWESLVGCCLLWAAMNGAAQAAPPQNPSQAQTAVVTPTTVPAPPEWVRSELIFSMQRKDGAELTLEEWEIFVAEVVVPRFPGGLTLLEAYGKPRGTDGSLAREPMNILILVHPNTEKYSEALQAVAAQYKKRFQLSVMRVKTPAEVKTY